MRKLEACLLVVFVSLAAAGSITAQQHSAATGKESRLTGLLLGTNQQADAGRRVLLIEVRLVDLRGREIRNLPPKADAIVDALVTKPVATAQSDGSGRFQFRAVKAGRYSVGVTSKPDGTFAADDVTLLRRMQDSFNTVVFDVAVGQTLDLGSLSRNSSKRNQTPPESRVRGVLVGAGGAQVQSQEVLLVAVQVLDLGGKAVPALPAKGMSIVGVSGGPSGEAVVKGKSRVGAAGEFGFVAAAGRYGVALPRPGGKDVELLVDPTTERPVVFDLAAGAEIDVGRVSPKGKN